MVVLKVVVISDLSANVAIFGWLLRFDLMRQKSLYLENPLVGVTIMGAVEFVVNVIVGGERL